MIPFGTARPLSPKRILALLVGGVLIGVIAGCDTTSTSTSDDASRADGVTIESNDFTRADLKFEPISVTRGEPFSISLMDQDLGGSAARITHEKTSDGKHALTAQFDPLQPASVSVTCKNKKVGSTQKVATLRSAKLKSGGELGPVASTARGPSSFHYIDVGGTLIVEVDYGDATPGTMVDFPSSETPKECTHISFALDGVSTSLSADGVRFDGVNRRPEFRQRRFR
jgi:hypothetical protein